MPTYRIPVSFYIEGATVADAAGRLSEYLDDASRAVLYVDSIFGVDIEDDRAEECAEECPPFPEEDPAPAPVLDNRGEIEAGALRPYLTP